MNQKEILAELEDALDMIERIPRLSCFYKNGGIIYNVTELPEPYNTLDKKIQAIHDHLENLTLKIVDNGGEA